MARSTLKRFYVDFNINALDDETRDNLVAGISKVAPSSQMIQGTPALTAGATALVTKSAAYSASRAVAAGSKKAADKDAAKAQADRDALDAELLSFVGVLQANARSGADITDAGLDERPGPAPDPPFGPPEGIDVTFPNKQKGRARVKPHGIKKRCVWVVQFSHDPSAPSSWETAHGDGNTRELTGPSGTSVWVRYAMLRDGQQSAFGAPVFVTFP